jgi:GT2 family glycosyltransferase
MMEYNTIIILVNFNSYDDTKNCLLSILKTEGDLPFVILVDNASTEAIDLYSLNNFYSKLKIIKNKENIGFGRANNVGIQWAKENIDFEYILLLNNDTTLDSLAIKNLIQPFIIDNKIGISTGKIMFENNKDYVWYGGGEINKFRGFPRIYDYNSYASSEGANKEKSVTFVSGCVMMFSKESINKLNGFDEEYFMYCEDLELSFRCLKNGYKLWYTPLALIYHKVGGSLNKDSVDKDHKGYSQKNPSLDFLFYHMKINQFRTMKKHLPFFDFILFNIFFWLEFFWKGIILIIKKPSFSKIVSKTFKKIVFN